MREVKLFPDQYGNVWQEEWKNMPEFVQEDLTSFKKVIVHFRNQQDFEKFEKLIGQTLKKNGMCISTWYPKMEKRRYADKEYRYEP